MTEHVAGTGPADLHPPQFNAGRPRGPALAAVQRETGPAGLHPPQYKER